MKICLVCSHGGHFAEMKRLRDALEDYDYFFVTYEAESTKNLKNAYFIKYESSSLKLKIMILGTFFKAFKILIKEKPDVIISTGGGEIAVPFCYIGKIFGINIIYIETLARVTTRSAGGRLVYPIADLFLVQWESLLDKYGSKAKYWGNII
ncbi:Oligosaccharide biosynthesis protein Alg14 like protein [uncultured archaeon]|nr:Oligosaccharide biosynthesis protein Alg14 like protein [uncultured archaeon]